MAARRKSSGKEVPKAAASPRGAGEGDPGQGTIGGALPTGEGYRGAQPPGHQVQAPAPPPVAGCGAKHAQLQEHLFQQLEHYRVSQKVLEDEEAMAYICGIVDSILRCTSYDELYETEEKIRSKIGVFVLGSWAKGLAKGPETPERLEEEAGKKESFAKWQRSMGGEKNNERAVQALEDAKKLRLRAEQIRRNKYHGT